MHWVDLVKRIDTISSNVVDVQCGEAVAWNASKGKLEEAVTADTSQWDLDDSATAENTFTLERVPVGQHIGVQQRFGGGFHLI